MASAPLQSKQSAQTQPAQDFQRLNCARFRIN